MPAAAQTAFQVRVTLSIGAMLRTPSLVPATALASAPSSVSSAVGTLRVPSLSLRRLTRCLVQRARRVARLDVEQREPAAAGRIALGARERERHLRGGRGGEPLRAVQPQALAVGARDRLGEPDVGAAGALGHPLARRPGAVGIAAGEARDRALDQRAVAVGEQRPRRAVGHRQRAGVDVGRRVEQVDERELVHARERAVRALVGGRDQPVLGGDARCLAPERRDLDAIDALAPGIPLREHRLVEAVRELQLVQRSARELAHLIERRLDRAPHIVRQRAREIRTQHAIAAILVVERGRILKERHGQ